MSVSKYASHAENAVRSRASSSKNKNFNSRKGDTRFENLNGQTFEIPISFVLSEVSNIFTQAKLDKQTDLVEKSCKIEDFCKDILKRSKSFSQNETVSHVNAIV